MFRPARMTRLLVSGHRQHQAGVIEALHQEKAVHIEDYLDPTGTTRIGEPLPEGQEVSDLLLRLRGLVKSLGSSGVGASIPVERPAALLAEAEAAISPVLARAAEARSRLQQAEAEQAQLAPLAGLDVDLAVVGALRSVRGFLGTAARDPRPLLSGTPHEAAVAPTERGVAVALFVAAADAAAAERALSESGFQSVEVPAGRSGTPARRLAALASEHAAAGRDAAAVEAELAGLRSSWG
ncbi:MAG TPA: hypothetical protein VI796_06420, partial [Candidatus Thermoplasmatota archaeon]|nr:hypothetical protein [Candidatus Thermoplasmatota archaeon]